MQVPVSDSDFRSSSEGAVAMEVDKNETSKLFFMMSSTLYTDKYMSILRELCSNARDAHAEVFKLDVPFAITAPSADYPFLVVSDAGPGLTFEKAQDTILRFLSSTKDKGERSGEMVGGWGIGSKSPRAYTDNYQVILRKDGVEWIVQVFNDGAGLPQRMLLSEHKTTKPNGVDMVIPIQAIHIQQWRQKVQTYISRTNYNVIGYMGGGEVIYPVKATRSFEYDNFILDVHGEAVRGATRHQTIEVMYGGMVYQIPWEFETQQLQKKIMDSTKAGYRLTIRLDTANAIKCGLSRETMEVDDANKNLILRTLLLIEEDLEASSGKGKYGQTSRLQAKTWAEVEALNNQYLADLEAGVRKSRLGPISQQPACSVYWTPTNLLKDGSNNNVVPVHSVSLALPLTDEMRPTIKAVYSDKTLLRSDVYWTSGEYKLECPIRTDDESEARTWLESLEEFKGLKVTLQYVESSRASSRGSGGSSAPRETFVICSETKKRYEFRKPLVVARSKGDLWLRDCFTHVNVFVPGKSFKSRRKNLPDEAVVWEYEDFIAAQDVKDALKKLLEGAKAHDAVAYTLEKTQSKLVRTRNTWPEVLQEEYSNCEAKVSRAYSQVVSAKRFLVALKDEYGEDIDVPTYDLDIEPLMKEANRLYVFDELHGAVFKVVDFPKVLRQYKEGNPEAMRLLWAMNLEKYLP